MNPAQIEAIASVAHEANRQWTLLLNDPAVPVQAPWGEASQEQRDSCIAGVAAIIREPDLTSEASHDRWVAWKIQNGWRLGPVKDDEAKTHPALVPYDELDTGTRAKDALFGAIVRALMRYVPSAIA